MRTCIRRQWRPQQGNKVWLRGRQLPRVRASQEQGPCMPAPVRVSELYGLAHKRLSLRAL